jgi:hypothetical protein
MTQCLVKEKCQPCNHESPGKFKENLIKPCHQKERKERTPPSGILVLNPTIKKKSEKKEKRRTRKAYHHEFNFWEPCHQESQFLIPQSKCFKFNENN